MRSNPAAGGESRIIALGDQPFPVMVQESLRWSKGEGEGNRLVFERLELLLECLVGVVFLELRAEDQVELLVQGDQVSIKGRIKGCR